MAAARDRHPSAQLTTTALLLHNQIVSGFGPVRDLPDKIPIISATLIPSSINIPMACFDLSNSS
jgi:hypothetical protein